MIIAISGKIKTGKDTLADLIEAEIGHNFIRVCFADYIKQTAANMLNVDISLMYDQGFKESEMPPEWSRWVYKSTGKIVDTSKRFDPENLGAELRPMKYREFLQDFGTELRKHLHPDIWVNTFFKSIELDLAQGKHIVIPDCRFPNEADNILNRGGFVYRLNRSLENRKVDNYSWEILNHESETALDNYDRFSMTYDNDGTLDELKKFATQCVLHAAL
jgi:predicted AAA+ superfamily ATPase